jgi:hypothetical protein
VKISNSVLPVVLLVVAIAWTLAIFSPLVYYLFAPNPDIRALVGALEGRQHPPPGLDSLVQQANAQVGLLKRAIPVAAYYGASAELNVKKSHTTKTVEVSYWGRFQKQSKSGLFIISRAETDNSQVSFDITQGDPSNILRGYGLPIVLLAVSLAWLWKRRARPSVLEKDSVSNETNQTPQASV